MWLIIIIGVVILLLGMMLGDIASILFLTLLLNVIKILVGKLVELLLLDTVDVLELSLPIPILVE